MVNIKSCPCCGNTNLDITGESDFYFLQGENGKACLRIGCWECYLEMFDHTYSEKDYNKRLEILLMKWNRRIANENGLD